MVAALQNVQPQPFGRYVLLDRIAEGGMAEVFRAIMPGAEGFKRTFVIKRILSQLSQSANFVDMFVREARIGAMLNHPNIVQVYDFGSVDGHYFMAMEYRRRSRVHRHDDVQPPSYVRCALTRKPLAVRLFLPIRDGNAAMTQIAYDAEFGPRNPGRFHEEYGFSPRRLLRHDSLAGVELWGLQALVDE